MEVSVDVGYTQREESTRARMVMIIFAGKRGRLFGIHACIIDTFNFIY